MSSSEYKPLLGSVGIVDEKFGKTINDNVAAFARRPASQPASSRPLEGYARGYLGARLVKPRRLELVQHAQQSKQGAVGRSLATRLNAQGARDAVAGPPPTEFIFMGANGESRGAPAAPASPRWRRPCTPRGPPAPLSSQFLISPGHDSDSSLKSESARASCRAEVQGPVLALQLQARLHEGKEQKSDIEAAEGENVERECV